jgi:signal transduction histidine kinase
MPHCHRDPHYDRPMLQRLPLRLQLTLPYVVLLLALAGTVGWLSYRSADRSIDEMAGRLHLSSAARIEEATSAYLTNWQYVLAAAQSSDASLSTVERRLWEAGGLSSVRPSYVYFAARDGRFVGVERTAQGATTLKLRATTGLHPRELFEPEAPGDRRRPLGPEAQSYVAVTRPWYEAAAAAVGDTWSPVYLDYTTRAPMVTLARAVQADDRRLLGVYGADVPLAQLETFLRGLQIAKQGLAYIVTGDGRMVASSLSAAPAVMPGAAELAAAGRSGHADLDASFRAIAARMSSAPGDASARTPPPELLDTDAGRMLVSAWPLSQHPGLGWWVVVAQREDVLTAGIMRNAWRTAGLTALAALATLLMGTWVLRSLLGEVRALTRATETLSAEQSPAPLASPRRDELGRLSNAFDRMVARLHEQIAQKSSAQAALAEHERQLQQLAGALLTAQSEERRGIARELHDELGQQLAALRINLQVLRAQAPSPADGARLDDSLAIVAATIEQVRNRALDLHPSVLDDLGLAAALQWMCERQAQRSGVAVALREDVGDALPPIAPPAALACYRIAQEAIANALKHGRPQRVDVGLRSAGDRLHLTIDDDGSGIAPGAAAGASLGMVGMRERAQQLGGTLEVTSQHNRGTRVRVEIPLAATT